MLPQKECTKNYSNKYTKKYTKPYRENIPSFGLIPFHIKDKHTKDPTIFYLLQQRRDSFEYGENLQGFWQNTERLFETFELFTVEELKRYKTHPLEELWDDLWIDKESRNYKEGYARAKKKYDEITPEMRRSIMKIETTVESPPWGFPKGRKKSYTETDKECAIRESEEECRVPQDLYRVLPFTYSEKFMGSNGVNYSTTYFLCEVKEMYMPPRIDTSRECIRTSSISEEVSDVKWLQYNDACDYLNTQRQSILYEADKKIKEDLIPK